MDPALYVERIRALSAPLLPLPSGHPERLGPIPGLEAVFFDVYGTCFVSGSGDIGSATEHFRAGALREALAEQGVMWEEAEAREGMECFHQAIRREHERLKGEGTEWPEIRVLEIWETWCAKRGLDLDLPRLAIGVECRINPVWPMPGLRETLSTLRRCGLRLGIVSNAQVFTPFLFEAFLGSSPAQLGFLPDACVWSWIPREAKPSVHLYQMALEGMGSPDPARCLYVGNDMRNDIAPAAALGMRTALFAGDARSLRLREGDPLVAGTTPDLVLGSLPALLPCLS